MKLTSSDFLLVRDFGVQISTISVVHDDAEAALVHEGLLVGNDIGMAHGFENVDLERTDGLKLLTSMQLQQICLNSRAVRHLPR